MQQRGLSSHAWATFNSTASSAGPVSATQPTSSRLPKGTRTRRPTSAAETVESAGGR